MSSNFYTVIQSSNFYRNSRWIANACLFLFLSLAFYFHFWHALHLLHILVKNKSFIWIFQLIYLSEEYVRVKTRANLFTARKSCMKYKRLLWKVRAKFERWHQWWSTKLFSVSGIFWRSWFPFFQIALWLSFVSILQWFPESKREKQKISQAKLDKHIANSSSIQFTSDLWWVSYLERKTFLSTKLFYFSPLSPFGSIQLVQCFSFFVSSPNIW